MADQTPTTTLPPLAVPEHVYQHVLRAYHTAGCAVLQAVAEWRGTEIASEAETGRLLDAYKPAVDSLASALLGTTSGEVAAAVARMQMPIGGEPR